MAPKQTETIKGLTASFDDNRENLGGITHALRKLMPHCESLGEIYYMEVSIAYMESIRYICDYEKSLVEEALSEADPGRKRSQCAVGLARIQSRTIDINEIYTRIMTVYRGEMNIGLRALMEDALEIIKSLLKTFDQCEEALEKESS